jgi:hypothetical protein
MTQPIKIYNGEIITLSTIIEGDGILVTSKTICAVSEKELKSEYAN